MIINESEIACAIIAYNNPTFVKKICERIVKITNNVVIIDNHSTFLPMVDFLDNCHFNVIRLPQNYGHRVYELDIVKNSLGSIFLLTDPDIEISDFVTKDTIKKMYEISERYNIRKVGVALDIFSENIREDIEYQNQKIKDWEQKFWNQRVADQELEMYWADVDTTFCLVNNNQQGWPYIRLAAEYTSKHLPWYKNWEDMLMPGEYEAYMCGNRSTNWCKK
jgi:hypothetical protein